VTKETRPRITRQPTIQRKKLPVDNFQAKSPITLDSMTQMSPVMRFVRLEFRQKIHSYSTYASLAPRSHTTKIKSVPSWCRSP
jgi:hypothetical protein